MIRRVDQRTGGGSTRGAGGVVFGALRAAGESAGGSIGVSSVDTSGRVSGSTASGLVSPEVSGTSDTLRLRTLSTCLRTI